LLLESAKFIRGGPQDRDGTEAYIRAAAAQVVLWFDCDRWVG
jgi:hypothetical protein